MIAELRRPPKFLFDPSAVEATVAFTPHLQKQLAAKREGDPSKAFPTARRSSREIYRVLGNLHYPQLRDLLKTLEYCLANGYSQPAVLRTRARKNFIEALSELHAAEHFLLREFSVTDHDPVRGQSKSHDLSIRGHGISAAVEVYCPRSWEELDYLRDDLLDVLKNIDLPYDYSFMVEAGRPSGAGGLHPQVLADSLTPEVRGRLIDQIGESVVLLLPQQRNIELAHEVAEASLRLRVEVREIRLSPSNMPARHGTLSGPSLTGYAPEAMFDRLVDRNVRAKARERQAIGRGASSVLIVDLSQFEITSELEHPLYRKYFEETLDRHLGQGLQGYDVIAFCEARRFGQEIILHFQRHEASVDATVIERLFGRCDSSA